MSEAVPFHQGFRPDIQMARALAVSAVLAFHVWPEGVPAGFLGVDVFFVISGYLITGLLLREVTRTGGVRWSQFWKRRALRLLPASFLVLLAVLVLAVFFGDPATLVRTLGDTVAAVFYFENWHLAARATDYFALTAAPSPLQHFWSLAVEEQFYLLWPILLEVTLVISASFRRKESRGRGALLGVLTGLTLCSFGYGAFRGSQSPTAYFDSFARAWEFGLGGILAFLPTAAALKREGKIGAVLFQGVGWLGLALALLSFIVDLPQDVFPGTTALMPVAGAGLLLWAGQGEADTPLSSFSRAWPLQWLGRISYSLYLWHWPLIRCPREVARARGPGWGARRLPRRGLAVGAVCGGAVPNGSAPGGATLAGSPRLLRCLRHPERPRRSERLRRSVADRQDG